MLAWRQTPVTRRNSMMLPRTLLHLLKCKKKHIWQYYTIQMDGGQALLAIFGGLHGFDIASVKLAPSLFLQMAPNWKQNAHLTFIFTDFNFTYCVTQLRKWSAVGWRGVCITHKSHDIYLILICCIYNSSKINDVFKWFRLISNASSYKFQFLEYGEFEAAFVVHVHVCNWFYLIAVLIFFYCILIQ